MDPRSEPIDQQGRPVLGLILVLMPWFVLGFLLSH